MNKVSVHSIGDIMPFTVKRPYPCLGPFNAALSAPNAQDLLQKISTMFP